MRSLCALGPSVAWPSLVSFIAGTADDKLIAAHWKDLSRLTALVRIGEVSASLVLKRLAAYPLQNGLALALQAISCVECTLFTLYWLELPALQR
jgi:TnpA family transposase